MDTLLTPTQVAEMLAISRTKVYRIKHQIGYLAIGGHVRFEQTAIEAYIKQCRRRPATAGEMLWESRSGTAPPGNAGSSPRRVTADDINARLQQQEKQRNTPRSAARK